MPSDEPSSDAVLEALSRADALKNHRFTAWPPTIASESRSAITDELKWHRETGRGYELAAVALAELGPDADPELRRELAACARDTFFSPEWSFAAGTIGDALKRRAFEGLSVEEGARSLRVDWLAPYISGDKGYVLIALSCTQGGELRRAAARTTLGAGWALPHRLAPDWRARADEALRRALTDDAALSSEQLLQDLLQALLPRARSGRAAWLMARGIELLRPEPEAPVVEAIDGAKTHALYLLDVEHEDWFSSYGRVRLEARLVTREGGEIVEAREGQAYEVPLSAEDDEAPAPSDEAHARAAVDVWRAAMQEHLVRVIQRPDGTFFIQYLLHPTRPLSLIAEWVRNGPPGPPPAPPAPRAVIDPDRLAAVAARVSRFDEDEIEELRASADDQLLAAIEIDGWYVLFCPWHRAEPGTFEEDRLLLAPANGEAAAIAMTDPWNGHVMPIDGDAALFRVVTRFLREIVSRAGLDVAFDRPRSSDDDEVVQTSLLEWLGFPLPSPAEPSFPAIDHRVYGDLEVVDFVADFSFWAEGPFAMSDEKRAFYEASIATHYHAFIRAVIDPAFPRSARAVVTKSPP